MDGEGKFDAKAFFYQGILVTFLGQVIIGGVITWYFATKLESFKAALAEHTEVLKSALEVNAPQAERRRDAYLAILQKARDLVEALNEYYYLGQRGSTRKELMEQKLAALRHAMRLDSGFSGGDLGLNTEGAFEAVEKFGAVREGYADVCSDEMNRQLDSFMDTVMGDLGKAAQQQRESGAFDTTAKKHLNEAFEKLRTAIGEALGPLPIQ